MSLPIRARVRRLAGYELSKPPDADVRIDLNESPYDFPEELKDEVWRRVRGRAFSRYPEHPGWALPDAIGRRLSWPREGILVGNGSNELIRAALHVTLEPDTRVLLPRPSFSVYGILAGLATDAVSYVELGASFEYREELILEAVERSRADVVILCSPNNPTGSVAPESAVKTLCRERDRLVILDEAYHEFAGGGMRELLPDNPNLVLLRTFSKAWALAGMRVGYLIAHADVAREVAKAILPFNLNVFSESCALVALENEPLLRASVERIVAERARLFAGLSAISGVSPYASASNFILFEVDADPTAVYSGLLARGVLVRDLSGGYRLERALRVSVGTPEENDRFLEALRDVMGQL